MTKSFPKNKSSAFIKIYHGFGHADNLTVFGHVFKTTPSTYKEGSNNILQNIYRLLRLFFVKPLPGISLELLWQKQTFKTTTEADGFFRFEWTSAHNVPAGWHTVKINSFSTGGEKDATGEGLVFIPHITQFGFISDIDDTVMISHSATVFKRLKELFTRSPATRQIFKDVNVHYKLLASAHTDIKSPNPFFYVSSSEWNLYDYLQQVFRLHLLPEGAFLLNQVKRWFELWKTGKTKHEGKLLRIVRIMESFPNQQFILLGDNSQSDPVIYKSIIEKYPERIYAVYIRNVYSLKAAATDQLYAGIKDNQVHFLQFKESAEAIQHSKKIGLIPA